MNMESLQLIGLLFCYTCLRELTPTLCYYYCFRDQLLLKRSKLTLILLLLVTLEVYIALPYGGMLPPAWIYFFPLALYLPLGLGTVQASMVKKLLVVTFLGLPMVSVQTFAMVLGSQAGWGLDPMELMIVGHIVSNAVVLPLLKRFIDKNRDFLLQTQVKSILVLAFCIALLHLVGNIFIYNFNSPRTWDLFWGRFFITLPAFIFAHIIFYLLRQEELNDHLHLRQRYLAKLRQEEQLHFEAIHDSWQASRRLRHDTRHIALLLKEYTAQRDYAKIKQTLANLRVKVLQS